MTVLQNVYTQFILQLLRELWTDWLPKQIFLPQNAQVTSIDIDYRLSPGTRDDRSDSLVNYQRPKPRHWQRC